MKGYKASGQNELQQRRGCKHTAVFCITHIGQIKSGACKDKQITNRRAED